eukprot:5623881-Karenia_brevis.AAC.1
MDPEANPFWTEHGDRSVLNGWAAELDLAKDQRDKLGRWVPEQSDDYLRAARSTVYGIQDVVSSALRNNDPRITEEEVLDGLKEYLSKKSLDPLAIGHIVDDLRWKLPAEMVRHRCLQRPRCHRQQMGRLSLLKMDLQH